MKRRSSVSPRASFVGKKRYKDPMAVADLAAISIMVAWS